MNSKLHTVTDGKGRPIVMFLSVGETSDCVGARAPLSSLPTAKTLPGDRGYGVDWSRFLQAARSDRERFRPPQRLEPHRDPLRQMCRPVPLSLRTRSCGHVPGMSF